VEERDKREYPGLMLLRLDWKKFPVVCHELRRREKKPEVWTIYVRFLGSFLALLTLPRSGNSELPYAHSSREWGH
jgi:hypothetical protein